MRRYNFVVLKVADATRGEALNAGIVTLQNDCLSVILPKRLEKLRALSHALDTDKLRASALRLPELDGLLGNSGDVSFADRLSRLSHIAGFTFSEPSWFEAASPEFYDSAVSMLLKNLVEPEPTRLPPLRKRTRLLTTVKRALRAERVLARKGEDLGSHRIVSNYEIAEGLEADLLLKNGAMHVIETVDASEDHTSARKIVSDIAVSALVLEQARMTFGRASTSARLVYDASPALERVTTPSLEAAAHQGAELVNWASDDDRRKLLVSLASLATPFELKTKSSAPYLTATAQQKLLLH